MVRLYHKELNRLKDGQNVALVTVLENGKKYIEYHQLVKTKIRKYEKIRLFTFKNLHDNNITNQWDIRAFGERYQKRWDIVQDDGSWSYISYKYFAKLSQKDEMIMVGELLLK